MVLKKFLVAVPLLFSAHSLVGFVGSHNYRDGRPPSFKGLDSGDPSLDGYGNSIPYGEFNTVDAGNHMEAQYRRLPTDEENMAEEEANGRDAGIKTNLFEFIGLDLNPALRGCIMSGGSCLTNTGINLIDILFFGGGRDAPMETHEDVCRRYLNSWCTAPTGYPTSYNKCRESKKKFYKQTKQKFGKWPTKEEFEIRYPHAFRGNIPSVDEKYLEDIELGLTPSGEAPYFTCTARQSYIWLKNLCGNTDVYKSSGMWKKKDLTADQWAKIPVETCPRYY